MRVLGVDTCGPEGSVALAEVNEQGVMVLQARHLAGRTYSEDLMPAIREMLEAAGVAVGDLGAIVVVRGPGSFTGVRVGLSTAKGLAQAAGLPVIGVSRLQVLAQKAGSRAAVLDAGRGEMYFGLADDEAGEALLRPAEILEQAQECEIACCETKLAQVLTGARVVSAPEAEDAMRFAQARILNRGFDDLAAMDAHYLRRSEAELVAERRGQ
jgi:tRNA threonylcarbamoyladenosine biosynthesis protein TsaB